MPCVITSLFLAALCSLGHTADPGAYWTQRSSLLQEERSQFLGSTLVLSPAEVRVNNILMAAKASEFENCFDPLCFPPARHFFSAKSDIEKSEVFKIIKQMPKGAALHGHDTGMVSTEWLVNNATYRANLYACSRPNAALPPLNLELTSMLFSASTPASSSCSGGSWSLVSSLRSSFGAAQVDQWLTNHFTLVTENPQDKYTDVNVVWEYFMKLFEVTGGLLFYTPVFRDYFTQTMQELLDDNVQYLELRGLLLPTYELDGSTSDMMSVAAMYQDEAAQFLAAQQPGDWLGARFIYAPSRLVDNATMSEYVNSAAQLVRDFPEFIAGFDLVGQEDKGGPYSDYINQLLWLRDEIPEVKFFFHAGETNWQGLTDMNLVDAILLNSSRIGHGFALTKHPEAKKLAKERGIAIEVNPISNQVLRLVDDLRNHPVASLLAEDFPVVVSCDDPSFWGAKGLSYDFYQMFMGIAGREADLRVLKQLAINSLVYSSMNTEEETCALEAWTAKWDDFISSVLREAGESKMIEQRSDQPSAACLSLWNRKVQLLTNRI